MKTTVTVLFWGFETALLAFENSSTKITFNTQCIFDEALNRDVVQTRDDVQNGPGLEARAPLYLLLYELKYLLLQRSHTYSKGVAFIPPANLAKKALRALSSSVHSVLAMNFLSKIISALTSGSRRSCTGFLNWFVK